MTRWMTAALAGTIFCASCNVVGEQEADISLSIRNETGTAVIFVENSGTEPVTLNKLVINGQEGDPDCDIKVFRPIAPGAEIEVQAARCGMITTIRAVTDKGEKSAAWNAVELAVTSYMTTGSYGGQEVIIKNSGQQELTVQKLILNDQPSDPDCDVKVFRPLPAGGSINVSVNDCGQVNTLKIVTDKGEVFHSVPRSSSASTGTGNTTGM